MKLSLRKGYILVESEPLVRWFSKMGTGSSEAKGAAFFPFMFVRAAEWEQSWVTRHELTHFRQQFETFFLGLPILNFIERLYARLVLKFDRMDQYLYTATEQEAYLTMYNPDYLHTRPFGALWQYIWHKRRFKLIGPGVLEFIDTGEIWRPEQ